jgi:hypothetical protein
MEYSDFKIDFIKRTIQIIKQYDQHVLPNVEHADQYEVTLLINCLLGLLVLPKEQHLKRIPDCAIRDLNGWGLTHRHILYPGYNRKCTPRSIESITVRQVVTDLRHSIAHILFRTFANGGQIAEIEFHTDRSQFRAKIPVVQFREFVLKLGESIIEVADGT